VGVHLLWSEAAHAPGQSWAGVRFLTMSEPHRQRLRAWIAEEHMAG
ncbi:PilZ domain-containing protein, partial [Xanthomonas oryzae pv. oryzae]